MKKLLQVLLAASLIWLFGAAIVFASEAETIVIRGGRIETAAGGTIENGVIIIRNGKIEAVGGGLAIPAGARMIDASGCWILPGFIDAFTDLGLTDPAIAETDGDESSSPLTPQVRVVDGFDPANRFIPLARASGTTTALVAPGIGNLLAGQSAIIRLAGNDVVAMTVLAPAAMHANLGEAPKMRYGKQDREPMTRMGEAALLRQTLVKAQEYAAGFEAYEKKLADYEKKVKEAKSEGTEKPAPLSRDIALESLLPVLTGKLPLVITANRLDDILTALRIAEEFKIRIIINGGTDAFRIKEILASKDIPVLLRPRASYRLTNETNRAIHENAALLVKAGVRIAFQTGGVRDFGDLLPQAREAMSHGLSRKSALEALTINPARIFGADRETGSIEKGKEADLLIFEGDPLAGGRLRMAVIGGAVAYESGR